MSGSRACQLLTDTGSNRTTGPVSLARLPPSWRSRGRPGAPGAGVGPEELERAPKGVAGPLARRSGRGADGAGPSPWVRSHSVETASLFRLAPALFGCILA